MLGSSNYEETCEKIYPNGSKPAFIYRTLKIHKLKRNMVCNHLDEESPDNNH